MMASFVLNEPIISTEWNTHWYWMGTLISTEWEDKEETESRRRIKNPWKRDEEGWE